MFLKENFEKISSAIVESCENTPGVEIEKPIYVDNGGQSAIGIKVAVKFTCPQSQQPKKCTLEYLETDHNHYNVDKSLNTERSWQSLLYDINTDLKMLDITSALPGLEINGWSWPEKRVILNDRTEIYNFDKYFNLETGLFNIMQFLEEKNAALKSRAELRFFTSRGGARREAAATSTNLPTSYTSTLNVKITFPKDNTDAATKLQASASDDTEQGAALKP